MRKKYLRPKPTPPCFGPMSVGACLSSALLAAGTMSSAQAQDPGKIDKLEKENVELRKRLEALENVAQKEGILASGGQASQSIKALSELTVSGFVQASYFYNTSDPDDRFSDGYLWNTRHNSFSLNKVKLTLASPAVERSGDAWDAAFRVSLIWGEDSPNLNTGSPNAGFEAVREAYVELNVPVGTGLNVRAGQLISLLNYESGDGGAANSNFSQGYQWWYTGNGPAAGVQLGYNLTDWLDVKVRVQNGLYGGPLDINDQKTVLASIGIKPDDKTWISLIGFGGDGMPVTDTVKGGSVLAGRQITEKLNTGLEFDYFVFEPTVGPDSDLWSIGGWAAYDFTPKFGIGLRGEFLDDKDGGGLKGVGVFRPNFPGVGAGDKSKIAVGSPDADGNISSVALTLNIKPTPNVKIQPEVRYDHTSYKGGFDGKEDRFLLGAGITYLY